MSKRKTGFYWHCHHDLLLEWCYDYDERVEYINSEKSVNERPTRLRLFQPVKGKLPADLMAAGIAYGKACEARNKAEEDYYKAGIDFVCNMREAFNKASEAWRLTWGTCQNLIRQHYPLIEALHAKECGCKEWNGKEIVFPATAEAKT